MKRKQTDARVHRARPPCQLAAHHDLFSILLFGSLSSNLTSTARESFGASQGPFPRVLVHPLPRPLTCFTSASGVGKSLRETLLENHGDVKHSLHEAPVSVWSDKMQKVRGPFPAAAPLSRFHPPHRRLNNPSHPLLLFRQTDFRRTADDPEAQ